MVDRRRSLVKATLWGVVGAAVAYFFDPDQGRTRRTRTRDQVMAVFRRGSTRAERARRRAGARAQGLAHTATALGGEEQIPPNDAALTQKVRSEVFAGLDVPKDKVNINAEDGVVYLRGEVESPDQISALEQAARKVTGVVDVRNLLHTPGAPAPNAADVRETP